MQKIVIKCDHCKKEIRGQFSQMRFITGPYTNDTQYDLCPTCVNYLRDWLIGKNMFLPDAIEKYEE